jgi:hypothetical protein
VITVGIDQLERDYRNSHFGHGCGKLPNCAARAAESAPGVYPRSVRMPEQIAVAFQILIWCECNIDYAEVAGAEPFYKMRNFALARRIQHATGNNESSVSWFLADKNLIGREHHIFESFDGIDGVDFTAILLQYTTEIFPLCARFYPVHRAFLGHVGILLVHDIEIIRRTHEHLGHDNRMVDGVMEARQGGALYSALAAEISANVPGFQSKVRH